MADEQVIGQEPTPEAPQVDAGQQEEKFDAAYVRQLRAEAAKYRKEAQAASARVATFETERMTETERLQAQAKAAQEAAEAAQAELRKVRAASAVAVVAAKQGIDPDLLGKLISVEYNDAGEPANIEAAVNAVLKQYPQLKTPQVQMAATNPGRQPPKLTLADVKQMTPDQINARWEEVSAAMEAGK